MLFLLVSGKQKLLTPGSQVQFLRRQTSPLQGLAGEGLGPRLQPAVSVFPTREAVRGCSWAGGSVVSSLPGGDTAWQEVLQQVMSDVWVPSGAESKDVEASGFVWLWLDSQHHSPRVREIPKRAPQVGREAGVRAAARTPTSPQAVGHPDLFLGEKWGDCLSSYTLNTAAGNGHVGICD